MVNQPGQARPWRRHESYEEKSERRQERRQSPRQWSRTARSRRGAGQQLQSPRQREFLRRRNLADDAGITPLDQELQGRIPSDLSPRLDLGLPTQLQNSGSCPTLSPAHSLLCLSVTAEAAPRRGVSVSTQGTQTLTHPSTGLRDSSQQTDCGIAVLNKEMVQLSNYLKEALHRELLLKQKMLILQELFSTLLEASEKSWQGQLNEDKLKSKLRALENQLQACTQSYSKECMKKILIEMEDQKQTYEQKAKEALQKMLEDKLQTEQQLQNSQRSLAATREDLAFWKEHYTTLKGELSKMSTAHTELESSFHTLQSELQQTATQKEQLQEALHSLQSEHTMLHQRARALREDNNLKAEHISSIEEKLQKEQNQKLKLEATISHLHNLIQNHSNHQESQEGTEPRQDQVSTMQSPPLAPAKENQNALLEHPKEEMGEERLMDEMQRRTSQLTAKEKECKELRSELEALSEEYHSCLTRLRQCRHQLNHCQSKQAKKQHGHWIPLLVAVIAMAIATFLASYRP